MAYNIRTNKKKQYTLSPLLYVVFLFFGTTLAISVVRLGNHYYTQRDSLKQKQEKLIKAQQEKKRYELAIKKAQTNEYIETEARRLELARENETIIVGTFPTPTPRPTPVIVRTPIYLQWYNLFVP